MKVNMGPFTGDIIPVYGWEKRYHFMRCDQIDNYLFDEDDYTWYDKLIFGFFDKLNKLVSPLNRWSNNRKRKIKIHIDYYDVWAADHTLAMIIHPVLVKLKEQKHGIPHVDIEDLPTACLKDASAEEQWEWVIDEMIWTFSQHALQDDTDAFHHNVDQLEIIPAATDDTKKLYSVTFNHQRDPNKPAYWRDTEGLKKHHERKANGRRLFAKYYENLWD
jgi:hypothetical protein